MFELPSFPAACRVAGVCLLTAVCLSVTVTAHSALRVEAQGVEPFVLQAATLEDSTAWYDAEAWLSHFPGELSWDAETGTLGYREAEFWVAIKSEPPYALRNGFPLEQSLAVRRGSDGLLLSEDFLRQSGPELLGRSLRFADTGRELRRVVVDAGHGGADAGSQGGDGAPSLEKDLTLALALEVAEELRRAGYAVHLTRSGDHPISAERRAAVANYWGAELFVSLHAAGAGRPQARGFEVFVATPPEEGADPQRWEAGQLGHSADSRRWAEALRSALGETLATFDRGVVAVPNPMLEAVACPAAMVEIATLAWPGDAEVLSLGTGRRRIAGALVTATQQFFSGTSP